MWLHLDPKLNTHVQYCHFVLETAITACLVNVFTKQAKVEPDLDVGHFVLPDLSSKMDTPQMESIESCLLSGVTHMRLLYSSVLTT